MFRRFCIFAAALSLSLFLAVSTAPAEVKLPAIIGQNMALQQGVPVAIWGWAAPQEHIAVTFADHTKTTIADAEGKWDVKLDPLAASAEGREMIIKGSATLKPIALLNVVVGEVWLCSGQSNMEFPLSSAHDAAVEIPKAKHPGIRLFVVTRKLSFKPLSNCQGEWFECTPETASRFTAVGYYFGRDLHESMKVPVGLIHSSWGGTPAQSWTSLDVLKADPRMARYVQKFEKIAANPEEAKKTYETETLPKWEEEHKKIEEDNAAALAQWQEDAAAAKAAKVAEPPRPKAVPVPGKPESPIENSQMATVLYNGMIAPILPYTMAGTVWYQGESNAGEPDLYQDLFADMIRDWRTRWGQGDFPFLFVQLANYQPRHDQPTDSAWARVREAQLKTLALPKTGMAVIIDIGQADNIHPRDKTDVGQRLFLAAEHVAYGKDRVYSGPIYQSMTIDGDKVRLKFSHLGGGLVMSRGPSTQAIDASGIPVVDDRPQPTQLTGFAIAGADRHFVWATAKIEGDEVVVSNPKVKTPVAVRYAWADNPACDLYNAEGLPASPFRTDDWPVPAPATRPATRPAK